MINRVSKVDQLQRFPLDQHVVRLDIIVIYLGGAKHGTYILDVFLKLGAEFPTAHFLRALEKGK